MNTRGLLNTIKKPALIVAGLVLFYTVLGFLIVPWAIKSYLPDITRDYTGKELRLNEVKFNPYTLELLASGLEMKDEGGGKILGLNEFFVNYGLWTSIEYKAVSIDEIRLSEPYANVRINQDGSLNLASLAKQDDAEEPPEEEASDEPFPLWFGKIIIEKGLVDFSDLSQPMPFHEKLKPLDLYAKDITTIKAVNGEDNSFSFAFGSGGKLEWQGGFDLVPKIKSLGKISITGLRTNKIWEYIESSVNFKIQKGRLGVQADYAFDVTDGDFQLTVSDGEAELTDVSLGEKDSEQSLIDIADLSVEDISFDLRAQHLKIGSVRSNSASFLTKISESGEVNLTELFTGQRDHEANAPVENDEPEAGPEETSFLVDVSSLVLDNYLVDVDLQASGETVKLKFSPIRLEVTDFSNRAADQFNLKAGITVNESGKIEAGGAVSINPVLVDLEVKADQLALEPFQPYLDQFSNLKLTGGSFNLDSKIDLALAENGGVQLNVTGHAGVDDLNTVEKNNKIEFLKWRAVNLKEINFTLDPMRLDIAAVDVDGIETEFIINKDRTTNLDEIFPPAKDASASGNQKQGTPFLLNIGKVNFKNSSAFYADSSLILPFGADIKDLQGTVTKISSARKARSTIDINGKVNQTAPATIKGSVEAFDFQNHLDILMQFDGVDMTAITPYMAEFAGYKVKKGKLSVDLHYKIQNKELQATNKVVIDQLTLGEEIESPNSVSLPVKLAISLLKDSNGVIDLDLPIEGSLDDPEFSVFRLLGKVMLNILTKTVAAPFTMIAGLVDSDADLSHIIFTQGSAELSQEQKNNLDALAEGLNERPELKLEVQGVAFKSEDGQGLAEISLMRRLKAEAWEDMRNSKRPADINQVVLSTEDYRDLLYDAYEIKFPERAKETISRAKDAPNPASAENIYEQMKQQLVEAEPVSERELNRLAGQRAKNIMEYLTEKGRISDDRVFLLHRTILPAAKNNQIAVELKLGAD